MLLTEKPRSKNQTYIRNNMILAFQETPQVTPQVTSQVTPQDTFDQNSNYEINILNFCITSKTGKEIQSFINIADRKYFRTKILNPMLKKGLIEYTIPDKPKSKNQKYIAKK